MVSDHFSLRCNQDMAKFPLLVLKSFDDDSVFVIEKTISYLFSDFTSHFSVIILTNFPLVFLPLPNSFNDRQQSLYKKEVGISVLFYRGVFQPDT